MNTKKITLFACLLIWLVKYSVAQSPAHDISKSFIIDPTYNAKEVFPNKFTKGGTPWIYGYTELESWRLQVLRKEAEEANLLVGYPGNFHTAYDNRHSDSIILKVPT